MVGFELTNEQRLLEQSVREWGAREVAPHDIGLRLLPSRRGPRCLQYPPCSGFWMIDSHGPAPGNSDMSCAQM